MKNNGVICLVFMSSFWFLVPELSKIVLFLKFFADVSKKSKAVIASYAYTSDSFRFTYLKNSIGCYAMT